MFITEPETQKEVRDHESHRICSNEIDGIELGEITRAVVIRRGKKGFGPAVKVPDVLDRHQMTIEGGVGNNRHFRLSLPVIRWLNGTPPENKHNNQTGVEK